uniref:uncharacterized protein C10orf143 homolog n=1 Tax=Jaculus jaculus TaxID=51337 RepID=UPI001E1B334A|nr:uncharacterized protein C10orf143 homolog [Jaculus jaculus]
MDGLVLCGWRRRREEELPAPGDAKRACRRLEASGHEHSSRAVCVCTPRPWNTEDQVPRPPSCPAAPGPDGGLEKPSPVISPNGGRSAAQPCPRCIAGESGHFNHTGNH